MAHRLIIKESKSLPEDDQDGTSEEQFFQPEPYQQEQTSSESSNNLFENFSEKSEISNLWQNLIDAPKKTSISNSDILSSDISNSDILNSDIPTSTLGIATDRMDEDDSEKQVIEWDGVII